MNYPERSKCKRITLWRVLSYIFPGLPSPTKSQGFSLVPSSPKANPEEEEEEEEEAAEKEVYVKEVVDGGVKNMGEDGKGNLRFPRGGKARSIISLAGATRSRREEETAYIPLSNFLCSELSNPLLASKGNNKKSGDPLRHIICPPHHPSSS